MTRRSSPFLACGVVSDDCEEVSETGGKSVQYSQVRKVLEAVNIIKKITAETEVLHKNALAEARTEECVKLIGKIEELVGSVLREAAETQKLLRTLKEKEKNGREGAKIISVSRAFLEAMRNFERVQEDYRERYRKQLERQYRLIDPNSSQHSIDIGQMNDSQTSILLTQQIFRLSSEDSRARRELESMRTRNTEMHHLEKGIEEVSKLFAEISVLVEEQGDSINRVEEYVVQMGDDVEKAHTFLEKSVEMHKKQQARKRVALLIGITILLILVLIILNELVPKLFSFKGEKKKL